MADPKGFLKEGRQVATRRPVDERGDLREQGLGIAAVQRDQVTMDLGT